MSAEDEARKKAADELEKLFAKINRAAKKLVADAKKIPTMPASVQYSYLRGAIELAWNAE